MDIYTEFIKDLEKYLSDKLPDTPESTIMDISAYIGNRTGVLVNDAIRDIYRRDRVASFRYRKENDS